MQAGLDREEQARLRMAVALEHGRCEQIDDFDGTLATMTDGACYEFYPNRIRLRGEEAIKEWWRRAHARREANSETKPPVAISREVFFNDEDRVLILIDHTFPEDYKPSPGSLFPVFSVVLFEGLKISSESLFYDRIMSPYVDSILESPDFLAIPGVERF